MLEIQGFAESLQQDSSNQSEIVIAEQIILLYWTLSIYLARYVRTIWNAINPCPRPLRIPCNHMA